MEKYHISRLNMNATRLTVEGGVNLLPFYHVADGERRYRGHHRDAWMSAEATMDDDGRSYSYTVHAFGEDRFGHGDGPIAAALPDILAALDEIVEARYADEIAYYREIEYVGVRVRVSAPRP